MEKSIVIGKSTQAGFSLLELMIVMFIMVLLVSVALPTFQNTMQHARETVLKDNLHTMRKVIQQYTADKQKMPETLEDLVKSGYLKELPVDPITEKRDTWQPIMEEDPNLADGGQGIKDVKSGAEGEDSNGNAYNGENY